MAKELYRESILQDQYGLSIKNIPSVPCLPSKSSLCSAKEICQTQFHDSIRHTCWKLRGCILAMKFVTFPGLFWLTVWILRWISFNIMFSNIVPMYAGIFPNILCFHRLAQTFILVSYDTFLGQYASSSFSTLYDLILLP